MYAAGADVCQAIDAANLCLEKACAIAVPCTDGPGCIGAPCKSSANCTAGAHCSDVGSGWCKCDDTGSSWCIDPTCTTTAECVQYGPNYYCHDDGYCAAAQLGSGAVCWSDSGCVSGSCVNGACAGNRDTREGEPCQADDWCIDNGLLPGDIKCCPTEAGELLCTDTGNNVQTCRTKKAGEPCNYFYQCYSGNCSGSEYTPGVCY